MASEASKAMAQLAAALRNAAESLHQDSYDYGFNGDDADQAKAHTLDIVAEALRNIADDVAGTVCYHRQIGYDWRARDYENTCPDCGATVQRTRRKKPWP